MERRTWSSPEISERSGENFRWNVLLNVLLNEAALRQKKQKTVYNSSKRPIPDTYNKKECTMKSSEVKRFAALYERHLLHFLVISAPFFAVALLNPASCMLGVQPVITQNGAPSLVATGIVQNARTITPANGLISSRKNYYRCRILWQRLPCRVN